MIADTSSIAGYTIFREEPNDAAPDLSKQPLAHPLGKLRLLLAPPSAQ
jgi:primary-amine oxidase